MLNRALIAQYLWFTALKHAPTLKSRIAATILQIYYSAKG